MLNLKTIREEKGISQATVAKGLNISRQAYNNYELGKRELDLETLINLAGYFNCSVDYLLGRDESTINEDVLDRVNVLDQEALEFQHEILDNIGELTIGENGIEEK